MDIHPDTHPQRLQFAVVDMQRGSYQLLKRAKDIPIGTVEAELIHDMAEQLHDLTQLVHALTNAVARMR